MDVVKTMCLAQTFLADLEVKYLKLGEIGSREFS